VLAAGAGGSDVVIRDAADPRSVNIMCDSARTGRNRGGGFVTSTRGRPSLPGGMVPGGIDVTGGDRVAKGDRDRAPAGYP